MRLLRIYVARLLYKVSLGLLKASHVVRLVADRLALPLLKREGCNG